MKFYSSIAILFFSATILMRAQSYFPADSSVWHYEIVDVNGAIYPVNYTTGGDTLISSIQYRLVRTDQSFYYIYRTDTSGNVYTRFLDPASWSCTDTNELLTYSFNRQVGDSLFIRTCYGDSTLCILTIIDSVLTNHNYKKRFTFDLPFDSWPTCHTGLQMVWVEGIGSVNDLFYNLNFPNPLIICLAQYNFLSIDSFGSNIHLLTTTSEAITSSPNKVWISNCNILHSEDMIKSVAIFDLCGRCLFVQSNVARTEYELETIQHYSDGIYVIKVITAAGSSNFNLVK